MKKLLILSIAIIISSLSLSFAQSVGINADGSAPNGSAMLDVKSTNKGMLIPQIALLSANDATTIATPATSLLVYNTATVAGITPGYYYNAGTPGAPVWTRLISGVIDGSETKVSAGTNVTITGVGTAASPYVVNAPSGSYTDLSNKPVNATTLADGFMSSADKTKLNGIATGAEVNVNADWNALSGDAQILNKPTIPAADGSETKINAGANISISGAGTAASPYAINETGHYIGESFGDGIVFYVYDNGRHGLIAATADQSAGIQWYNGAGIVTNTDYTNKRGIGAGKINTERVVYAQGVGNYAAQICANYASADFSDWYLPSNRELYLLLLQKNVVGGFSNADYWTSNEINATQARVWNFGTEVNDYYNKSVANRVRAIRSF